MVLSKIYEAGEKLCSFFVLVSCVHFGALNKARVQGVFFLYEKNIYKPFLKTG